jgi:hypothetical protein
VNVHILPHPQKPGAYRLETELWLPRPLDHVFAFFSDPFRLEDITPPWLQFHVLTPGPVVLQAGSLLDYRLRWHGLPLRWRSEIAVWEPPVCFVDRQVIGPYRLWYHEHVFRREGEGTRIIDRVDYAVPGGALVHWCGVRGDLRRIFEYRSRRLRELLGAAEAVDGRDGGTPRAHTDQTLSGKTAPGSLKNSTPQHQHC